MTENTDSFCERCGVLLSMHAYSDPVDERPEWDCDSAEARVRVWLTERFWLAVIGRYVVVPTLACKFQDPCGPGGKLASLNQDSVAPCYGCLGDGTRAVLEQAQRVEPRETPLPNSEPFKPSIVWVPVDTEER